MATALSAINAAGLHTYARISGYNYNRSLRRRARPSIRQAIAPAYLVSSRWRRSNQSGGGGMFSSWVIPATSKPSKCGLSPHAGPRRWQIVWDIH